MSLRKLLDNSLSVCVHIKGINGINTKSLAVGDDFVTLEYIFCRSFCLKGIDGVSIIGILDFPIFFPIMRHVVLLIAGLEFYGFLSTNGGNIIFISYILHIDSNVIMILLLKTISIKIDIL